MPDPELCLPNATMCISLHKRRGSDIRKHIIMNDLRERMWSGLWSQDCSNVYNVDLVSRLYAVSCVCLCGWLGESIVVPELRAPTSQVTGHILGAWCADTKERGSMNCLDLATIATTQELTNEEQVA